MRPLGFGGLCWTSLECLCAASGGERSSPEQASSVRACLWSMRGRGRREAWQVERRRWSCIQRQEQGSRGEQVTPARGETCVLDAREAQGVANAATEASLDSCRLDMLSSEQSRAVERAARGRRSAPLASEARASAGAARAAAHSWVCNRAYRSSTLVRRPYRPPQTRSGVWVRATGES